MHAGRCDVLVTTAAAKLMLIGLAVVSLCKSSVMIAKLRILSSRRILLDELLAKAREHKTDSKSTNCNFIVSNVFDIIQKNRLRIKRFFFLAKN